MDPPAPNPRFLAAQSPEASVTAGSQIEFAIPMVAFIVVVQTPPFQTPI